MEILDARGLSCPEPVIKENVSNYGKKQGYNVNITEQNGEYTLTFTK